MNIGMSPSCDVAIILVVERSLVWEANICTASEILLLLPHTHTSDTHPICLISIPSAVFSSCIYWPKFSVYF